MYIYGHEQSFQLNKSTEVLKTRPEHIKIHPSVHLPSEARNHTEKLCKIRNKFRIKADPLARTDPIGQVRLIVWKRISD